MRTPPRTASHACTLAPTLGVLEHLCGTSLETCGPLGESVRGGFRLRTPSLATCLKLPRDSAWDRPRPHQRPMRGNMGSGFKRFQAPSIALKPQAVPSRLIQRNMLK